MNAIDLLNEQFPALSNLPVVTVLFGAVVLALLALYQFSRMAEWLVAAGCAASYALAPMVMIWAHR